MGRRRRIDPEPAAQPAQPPGVLISFNMELFRPLIAEVVAEMLKQWQETEARFPADRLAFTEAEAAALLGLSAEALNKERRLGRIPAIPSRSRRVRYSRETLVKYARGQLGTQ